ncbi:MAG: acetyl-CoA carboxylase carboxyltransferase subunit beta [Saprospiraceae bacterium]
MGWFKRLTKGVQTNTKGKKDTPSGLWFKCKQCGHTTTNKEMSENLYVCPKCNDHVRIGPYQYFNIIFDGKYNVLFSNIKSIDFLNFTDLKSYKDRLEKAEKEKPGREASEVAAGKVKSKNLVIAAMDFEYIGGSMGSVVGEKISRAVDYCIENNTPLMIISKSGGARMMESSFSLMQMAKTSVQLAQLSNAGIPYFSMLTNPTTGGVTASFAMLGDVNFAEPKSLIGFAGSKSSKKPSKVICRKVFKQQNFYSSTDFLISL